MSDALSLAKQVRPFFSCFSCARVFGFSTTCLCPPRRSPPFCPRARAQRDVDVFNALDLMENAPALLKDLKFGPGDGRLHYYLYNWQCPEMEPADVGLVLL